MAPLLFILLQSAAADENELSAIKETRSNISETERQQREELAYLYSINQKIKDIAKRKAQLNEKLLNQEASVRSLAQDVAEMEERSQRHRDMLNRRLRQLYQGRSQNEFQWIFSAKSPVELERNHRFLKRMADSDHRYVREYLEQAALAKRKKRELGGMVAQLVAVQKSAQAQEQELMDQMREKSRLVAELRKAKDSQISQLKDLRHKSGGGSLEYAFFERRGTLKPPVDSKVAREYGTFVDPQFRFRLMNKGNFYSVSKAQPITAVFGGQVALASKIPGYGQCVILDHGDNYYSVYAFASQLKVREGRTVKEGEVIALSGDDSALFGPGLYFEIRHFTDAIDPRPWIKEPGIKTATAYGGGVQ